MRTLVVPRTGGPEVLEVQQGAVPAPGPGELLVEVAAAGVNFIDVYQRQGVYPVPTPFVLGREVAGRVRAVGAGVSDFAVGDVVASADAAGGAAELTLVPAGKSVPVPDGLDPSLAAAVTLQGMTAHFLVNSTYPVQPGDVVLVHAAAGGVGQLLVQLAATRGARVIGTVGSAAKADIAHALGADEVIRYDEVADLAAAVRTVCPDGVHVVYDGVGAATFDASLESLRPRGMLVLFGGTSGQVPPVDPQRLNRGGSLFLTRPFLGHYTATPEELRRRAGEIFAAVTSGALRVQIGGRYPLEQAADAYRELEERRSTGKLLLVP